MAYNFIFFGCVYEETEAPRGVGYLTGLCCCEKASHRELVMNENIGLFNETIDEFFRFY